MKTRMDWRRGEQGWIEEEENKDGLKKMKQGWIEGDENKISRWEKKINFLM